ncbi:MAG: helix-turn-helix domain-containing protein [Brevinema sp.]
MEQHPYSKGGEEMSFKTVKEIADELGVDKQKVYRIIKKNRINEAVQDGQVKRYDEAVQSLVKSELLHSEPHQNHINEPHQNRINEAVVALLKTELEAKNELIKAQQKTIDRLTSTVEAYSQKELAGKLIEGQKLIEQKEGVADPQAEVAPSKKKKWQFWKD